MRRIVIATLATALSVVATTAGAQTTDSDAIRLLRAPGVMKSVRLYFDAGAKKFMLTIDGGEPEVLAEGITLTTPRLMGVYWRSFNPLLNRVSTNVTAVPDESSADLTELLKALGSVAKTLQPETGEDARGLSGLRGSMHARGSDTNTNCTNGGEVAAARAALAEVVALLSLTEAEPSSIGAAMRAWRSSIASTGGARGVIAAREAIAAHASAIEAAGTKLSRAVEQGRTDLARAMSLRECNQDLIDINRDITQPWISRRAVELGRIAKAIATLGDSLAVYADQNNWDGSDYRILSITSDPDEKKTVKVNLSEFTMDAQPEAVTFAIKDVASTAFDLRHYGTFVREIGAGLVVSNVEKPSFGTGKDAAGKTVVTQAKDESVSYNAGIFLNLLMRVGKSPATMVPMIQVGASPNPDSPTVFVGGGLRLFGNTKGGFAIAGGLALPWVKTLDVDKLPLGTEVAGTSVIEENMVYKFQPRKWYVTLQFTF